MTPVQNLPKGWAISSVGEVATYQNGRAFKPSEWVSEGVPIIRIQNLNDANANYNFSDKEHEDKFRVKYGDLLYAWSATLGAYIWRGQDAWLNQHIFKVNHTKVIDQLFLYYALTHITDELYNKSHGTGMVHITKGKFEETRFRLPPLNEQYRIVARVEELFSELNKGVESLKTAREQLKVYRQAVLKHAFEGKLTEQWRERNKHKLETTVQLLARIKKEREKRYQEQLEQWSSAVGIWEMGSKMGKKPSKPRKIKPLTQLQDNVRTTLPNIPASSTWGKVAWMTCGVEYGTSAKSSKSGNMPVLRMGNIQNGKLDWDDLAFTSDDEEIEKYSLIYGDVLFNRTNSPELVGKTAIYRGERPALFAGYLIRVNHIQSIVDSHYLNLFLNSSLAKHYGNSVKTDGVNQSNINGEKLKGYPFPYCSLAEQQEIVSVLDEKLSLTDQLLQVIDLELFKSNILRQSILKQAFSGQLVEQDPNDEPASILLERFRAEKTGQENTNNENNRRKTGEVVV